MPDTTPNSHAVDIEDQEHKYPNKDQNKSSLRSKLKMIREKADAEIAELRTNKAPIKREIRSKVYDLNRRIKAINQSLDQNNLKIENLKNGLAPSPLLPVKQTIKLIKFENTMLNSYISVYSEIIDEFTAEINTIDEALKEKIMAIQDKMEKSIKIERAKHVDRLKQKAEKQRAKYNKELEAKREAKKSQQDKEKLKSKLRLRQYVNFNVEPVITDNTLSSSGYKSILASFNIVKDIDLVQKVLSKKLDEKYFTMLRKRMADVLNVKPEVILVISTLKNESDNSLKVSFHLNKDRKIENLITQFGFTKNLTTGNMDFDIAAQYNESDLAFNDLQILFKDLSKCVQFLIDVESNILFQRK